MIKVLLGVRKSTPSANCLIELGQKNLKYIVNERRKSCLMKKFSNIDIEEPLHIMVEICKVQNTNSYKMIINSMSNSVVNGLSPRDICLNKDDTHTKFVMYRRRYTDTLQLRPEMTVKETMKQEDITYLCEFIYHCMKLFNL